MNEIHETWGGSSGFCFNAYRYGVAGMGKGMGTGPAVIAAGVLIGSAACSVGHADANKQQAARTAPPPASAQSATSSARFRDGTYRAEGWYGNLPSHLDVSLRLEQGVIRDVRVGTPATDPTSLRYQRAFAQAVPAVVVGRRIEDVKVGRLAGSSGCPTGFNDALRRIRAQAQGSTEEMR